MVISETVAVVEAGAPIGPGEAEESAFLAEQRLATPPSTGTSAVTTEEEERNFPLPPMDDLIKRIPAGTREVMDQLFRAKFITVRRMPVSAFKTQN